MGVTLSDTELDYGAERLVLEATTQLTRPAAVAFSFGQGVHALQDIHVLRCASARLESTRGFHWVFFCP